MSVYKPPTKVVTLQIPWLAMILRADPNWARQKASEPEYEFSRRTFYCNNDVQGAYSGVWDNPVLPLPAGATNVFESFTPEPFVPEV